jgi:hypothetical protein
MKSSFDYAKAFQAMLAWFAADEVVLPEGAALCSIGSHLSG